MKVSAFIMAFYILLLAAMSCCDTEECEIQTMTEQANLNGYKGEEEGCTPFCLCVCCPPYVYVSDQAVNDFSLSVFSASSFEINSSIQTFILQAIWQPPRTV